MTPSHNEPFSEGQDRRRSPRHDVPNAPVVTAMAGGKIYTCHIQDISLSGVRLRFEGGVPKGRVIALDHPRAGTLCGLCVWKSADAAGVELQHPNSELERALRCVSLIL
jgi:hypothetical protein